MESGAHLPLIPMSAGPPAPAALRDHAAVAAGLGYRWLTANDHLVFRRPWIDGLAALASVIEASGDMGLATTVCLPAARGPVPTAKAFTGLDLLSGGRFANGVATAWTYVTEERALRNVLAPLIGRPAEHLASLALPIGPAERCAERVAAFRDAGAQRLFIRPLGDELAQLERFMERVAPLASG